ncbi:MAG TPA: glycosyltransferase family 39 protein [Dehalococcoidia bacterium]|nr:glycosyltransferase family 39 protein [Dehalococcoidia bacterium]
MASLVSRLSRRNYVVLPGLVLLAFGLRLWFSEWAQPVPPPFSDAEYYDATARSLARGDGYRVLFTDQGFRPGGEATAFYPPGYSFFLAAGYAFFGEGIGLARGLNAAAGALTVVPVYWLGRRFGGTAAGLAAGVLVALSPSLIAWTPVLLSETWFTFLFALALAFLPWGPGGTEAGSPGRLLGAGVVVGLAALARGQALLLLPAWSLLLLWQGRGSRLAARSTALLTLGAAAVLAPWAARSSLALDSPVLLSTNFGYNLRVGHAPYASGRYETPHDLWSEQAPDFQALEVLFNDEGRQRALDYALSHPAREAELAARKVVALWRPDTDALTWVDSYGLTPLPDGARVPLKALIVAGYITLLALAAFGLARCAPDYRRFAFVFLALWALAHIVFFGEPRYHLPLLALLAPAAGRAVILLQRRASRLLQSGAP